MTDVLDILESIDTNKATGADSVSLNIDCWSADQTYIYAI